MNQTPRSSEPAHAADPADLENSELRRRTLRKVSLRLMPFVGLLYFINYLDRTNIGFAGPNGMNQDLGMTQAVFGVASGVFFIGYLLLEIPSNLMLHRFGARRWIARILVTWGIIAAAMAFVPNVGWLLVLRFLLGVAEAGFFPGIILYLTFWFPKADRAKATAFFLLAIPASSVLGAPVSALLIQHGHDLLFGMAGWRFMLLMEGLPAVLLGIICWFFLTDRPSQATWLKDDERQWLAAQMDAEESHTARSYHLPTGRALASGRVWAFALVYFGITYGLYAISFFLPTIIGGFQHRFSVEYSLWEKGLLTAVPFACGGAVMLLWARHGDRTRERVWHVALPTILGAVVIPITVVVNSPLLSMVCLSVFTIGVMSALASFWPLPTVFLSGTGAAAGVALINSVGNTSGFFAPYITGYLNDLTGRSSAGMIAIAIAMALAAVMTIALGALPKNPVSAPPQDTHL